MPCAVWSSLTAFAASLSEVFEIWTMIKDEDCARGMSETDLLFESEGSRTAAMTVLFGCPRYASTRPRPIPVQVLIGVTIVQDQEI